VAIFRRKTKREREQSRIEASWMRRGEHPADVLDPDVAQDVERYTHLLREQARVGHLPEPAPDFPLCPKHPGWQPERPFEGAPRPPKSQCPHCLAEAEEQQPGPDVWVDGVPRRGLPPALDAIWKRKLEERRANGEILPGSFEEADVIAEMDARREESRPARRVVLYSNPITGVVIYGKPRTRRQRYLLRF
jgi:hypothetical protein